MSGDARDIARDLVAAIESAGLEGFVHRLDEVTFERPSMRPLLIVEVAERLLFAPASRRAIAPLLEDAVDALLAADEKVAAMRGFAVAVQSLLADGLLDRADALDARFAAAAATMDHPIFAATAGLLRAQLELRRGDAGAAAARLDQLAADLTQPGLDEPHHAEAVLALRIVAWSAVGDVARLAAAVDQLAARQDGTSPLVEFHRAVIAESRGDLDRAIEGYRAVIAAGEVIPTWTAEAHLGLARLIADQADRHLATAAALGDADDANLTAALARADLRAGRYREARARADRMRGRGEPATLAIEAEVYAAAGPSELARDRTTALIEFAAGNGLRALEAEGHILAARSSDDPAERALHLDQARILATATDDVGLVSRALLEQGLLAVDHGEHDRALEAAAAVGVVAARQGRIGLEAGAHLVHGLVASARADHDLANHHFEAALALADRINLLSVACRALRGLGRDQEADARLADAGWQP